ncbi:MAG: phage tail tape measure protein, partial [Giesbergeria sp.]|nr:phage tail tape measure protein [Giesbergeria sp.]
MGEQQRKLAELRKKHGSEMMHVGMMAAGSAALMAGGNKMAGPLRSVVGAFMPAENSETQLRASMMTSTGAVGPEFQQILDLATRLGDRLPGTTADFIDMMTMLRRQGMTSKAILGGLGESAAYLGIQLRMPVTAAAEFASKMQDATQTAEGDMMGLMDTIQRAYYLGVDPTNMLQGFTKISAVMPFLGEKGLQASKMLAPLLVMMDQTGMAGESAGNAIRKVAQLSLDA